MNAVLCLRFDLDTFSTRHEFIKKVGLGEYVYLSKLLKIASTFDAKLQFCVCGQGLLEYSKDVQSIKNAGHSVDSHLYSHCVTLLDPVDQVAKELVMTEDIFLKERIEWTGIGATGMYPQGIDGRKEVYELLQKRGYRWCSSKFNLAFPLEEMQPYWLCEGLLEIPCAGWSDMGWWYYSEQEKLHQQNGVSDHTLTGFIQHGIANLRRARDKNLVYAICLHPGTLSKHDPECGILMAILTEARSLGIATVDMNQIRDLYGKQKGGKTWDIEGSV